MSGALASCRVWFGSQRFVACVPCNSQHVSFEFLKFESSLVESLCNCLVLKHLRNGFLASILEDWPHRRRVDYVVVVECVTDIISTASSTPVGSVEARLSLGSCRLPPLRAPLCACLGRQRLKLAH